MIDTATEREALARLLRELERQLKANLDVIFKPVVPLPDHVRYYFATYLEYLKRALAYPELPQRDLFQQDLDAMLRHLKSALYMHRDNLGDLSARIGALASALEASVSGVARDLTAARAEISGLKEVVARLTQENDDLRRHVGESRSSGGKAPGG